MPTFQIYGVTFHWRDDKWQATYDKRKIEITEAVSVFEDPYRLTDIDDRFDYDEMRMVTVGLSNKGRLLTVAWVEIDEYNIKIITAFKAGHDQAEDYYEYRQI